MIRSTTKSKAGFSLIELLVVLMLISLVLSLVSPSVSGLFARYEEQEEKAYLRRWVKQVSYRAVVSNRTYRIHFSDDAVSASPLPAIANAVPDESGTEVLAGPNSRFNALRFPASAVALEAYPSGLLSYNELIYQSVASKIDAKRIDLEGILLRQ